MSALDISSGRRTAFSPIAYLEMNGTGGLIAGYAPFSARGKFTDNIGRPDFSFLKGQMIFSPIILCLI